MLIRRSLAHDGNLMPLAFCAIASIPDSFLFNTEHDLRHPKSAYGTSLRLISGQWLKALDELDRLRSEYLWKGNADHMPVVIDAYTQLLHRINEHHDACYSVLRSLCPASSAKATQIDTQFLDKAKLAGWKQFRDATKAYREGHIGLIVNTLKHKQGELCPIYFKSNIEFRPGYYLRDVLPGGAMGPSRKLHSGGNTAFSFGRDMLMHLWWLYRIGDLLAIAITTALQVRHTHTLEVIPQSVGDANLTAVLERCAQLRPEFFPDEITKPYPRILFQPVPTAVTLEFPTTARGICMGSELRVVTQFVVDGAHLSEKMPYFGHM